MYYLGFRCSFEAQNSIFTEGQSTGIKHIESGVPFQYGVAYINNILHLECTSGTLPNTAYVCWVTVYAL